MPYASTIFNIQSGVHTHALTGRESSLSQIPLTLFGCDAEGKVTASFGPVSTLYPSNSFPHLNKPQAVPSPLPL